jgi:hypothetical protein
MSPYNLVHCIIPDPRAHVLKGYKEVIETVRWGLEQLGHYVTYTVNEVAIDATNIVFGAQVMPRQLPDNTIIYNFEQLRGLAAIREELKYLAAEERFRIWEYSQANLASWHLLGRRRLKIVPVGYAPLLTRIPKPPQQDIDVLIYGLTGERRLQVFHALSHLGLSIIFACGFYGSTRDDLIARSKIVLNINLYQMARIFEIVGVHISWQTERQLLPT